MSDAPWFAGCAEKRVVAGAEAPWHYGSVEREVAALRTSAALSVLPHAVAVRVLGEHAGDVLDRVLPGEVFLREGQARPALLLDESGAVRLDLYLLADEDGYTLVGESAEPGGAAALCAAVAAHTRSGEIARTEDWSNSHTLLSLNGPFAWEVLAEVEGPELIAFPYLSFYKPDAARVYVRAGKTGEFGYDLLVPRKRAGALWDELLAKGARFELAPAGLAALWQCALENWWFNVHAEGRAGATPVELQLQWRVNFRKEGFVGADAVRARKARESARQRLTPVVAAGEVRAGDGVYLGAERIGTVASAVYSSWAERWIAAALLDLPYAQSGVERYEAVGPSGERVALRTVSAPFVNNLSLVVSPQRHSFADRERIVAPPRARF